jgi:hypothetical protein
MNINFTVTFGSLYVLLTSRHPYVKNKNLKKKKKLCGYEECFPHLTFDILCRKQELRELKMLQKQEQKQFQDLSFKAQFAKDQQV